MDRDELNRRIDRVQEWLDGGCNSWGLPQQDIQKIAAALFTQAGRVAELEMRLSQAADNLAACARIYNCPGAAEAERLARKALGREDGEG